MQIKNVQPMKHNVEGFLKKIPKVIEDARKYKDDFSLSIKQADL